MSGTIVKVSGPLIVASGMGDVELYDVVRVSEKHLIGEVIELRGDMASIQVYEETAGLGPGEPVESTRSPLSVELAPGLIEGIFESSAPWTCCTIKRATVSPAVSRFPS